jgi:hypothetical protein
MMSSGMEYIKNSFFVYNMFIDICNYSEEFLIILYIYIFSFSNTGFNISLETLYFIAYF